MRRWPSLALVLPLVVALLGLAGCDLPDGFHDTTVFSGLTLPTAIEFSPDGRVFVAEKRGVIKVFDGVGDPTPTVFADLRTKVYNSWDRGMLGLALHPDFPANPSVYVLYTYDAEPGGTAPRWGTPGTDTDVCPTPPGENDDGCVVTGRLSRLTANGDVSTGTEDVLITDWCQQYPSHSIGTMAFAPDGALYVSGGEGASFTWADYGHDGVPPNPCGDPPGGVGTALTPPTAEGGALRAQDLRTPADPTSLGGTIIRIDPDTGAAMPDNPLASSSDPNTRRIVAYGMRNPFRFTIRPGTDELWVGDVGWGSWEEVNRTVGDDATVDNFGWPCYEGAGRQGVYDSLDLNLCESLYSAGGVTPPVYAYRHDQTLAGESCPSGNGSSISGVALSPANGPYPDTYDGALFFADASRGCIWVMRAGAGGQPDPSRVEAFHQAAGTPVELEIGPGGDLWYVDLYGGSIHRVTYSSSSSNAPPVAAFTATPTSGDPPLTVAFDGRASTDSDPGDVLTYAWDLDGDGAFDDGTADTASFTYTTAGSRTVGLRVTDTAGASDVAQTTITVGSEGPVPTISSPAEGTLAAVGASVSFSGSATTAGGGPLPASALSWNADLLHCTDTGCHRHPAFFAASGVASGSFVMPDHEYPAYVELHLTATSNGESATVTRRIDYRTADVTLAANVSPVNLTLGVQTGPAPLTRTLPQGGRVTISAPATMTKGQRTYTFANWSDGGARSHDIVVPASATTLTATYVR